MKLLNYLFLLITTLTVVIALDKKKKYKSKLKLKQRSNRAEDAVLSSSSFTPSKNLTNIKNLSTTYQKLINDSAGNMDSVATFKTFQNWDYNMLPYEIQDIFQYMLFRQEKKVTQDSLKIFYHMFVKEFTMCDLDHTNTLTYPEWLGCLKNQTVKNFKYLIPPETNRSAFNPIFTTTDGYYKTLFEILDIEKTSELNFSAYMKFRLYVFSWSYCSVFSPHIQEKEFECALSMATKLKPTSRTKIKNLYQFWLDQSTNESLNNFDFILYTLIVQSSRLYAQINKQLDTDISRKDFEIALDTGILPKRYNKQIVAEFFKLIERKDKTNGLDLLSFTFYDYHLTLFSSFAKSRPYYINYEEYKVLLDSMYFPNATLSEMYMSPQYNLTSNSYNMYQFANISVYNTEADFFYKFTQSESKSSLNLNNKYKLKTRSQLRKHVEDPISTVKIKPSSYHSFEKMYNISLSKNMTAKKFFDIMDVRQNGYISFYDYANLLQLGYVFTTVDSQLLGAVTADNLMDFLNSYSNFPLIGWRVLERAYRLSELFENAYLDFFSFSAVLKIDDLVSHYFRESYQGLIYEVELKKLLAITNMRYVPDTSLNTCLRGVDSKNIPIYDWECAFKFGLEMNLSYFKGMNDVQTSKMHNLTITNTGYYNIDPQYS